MAARELHGTWTPLPLVQTAGKRIKGSDLALGEAGAFLGVCEEGLAPWVRLGRWEAGAWTWSAPWTVPPRPDNAGAPDRWVGQIDEVGSVWLAIDRLDPMRIAINRTEYQGGSYGVVVGRWGGVFDQIESPTDSDIRFGQPIVLRGDELWSNDMSALWHFRRVAGSWRGVSTDCTPQFSGGADELGWIADVASDGRWVVQDVWTLVAVFERRPVRGGGERFAWTRTLASKTSVKGMAQTPNGLVVVHEDRDGVALEIVLHDEDLRPIQRWTLDEAFTASSAVVAGHRVVLHRQDALLVFDLYTGSVTHQLMIPKELVKVGRYALNASVRIFGDVVCVMSDWEIGVYEL
ncbi:hypothetical protein DB30_06556 [Enhygromyxa salina]|uniref:Uncharacterized protein n=1 Tax=Enhygromyxa salina TaxID=215803 RepID=A0A0C2DBW3_9BACT|nr:hypothetical protein [Enhygromyxa salina]KIG18945.1 hypothetical protein DB30_06556 [Enhygromyxa salina]